jgi:hypothetical protein
MHAVGDDDEARFLALQALLDDDAVGRVADLALDHHRVDCLRRFGNRLRDHDALAGGESVGLDDDRRALLLHVRFCFRGVAERGMACGRGYRAAP